MAITALPTPPSRADAANFADRGDAFLGALPAFQSEANALATDVNAKQVIASNAAVTASAAAAAATSAANATKWVSGTNYAEGVVVFSPITYLSYRRKTAGVSTIDPSLDEANWAQVAGTGDVSLTATQTLTNKTVTDLVFDGKYTEEVFTITDGASVDIDPANGTVQVWTLGANRSPTATNFASGQSVTLLIDDDDAYAITWTGIEFKTDGGNPPTLNTTGFTVIQLWKVDSVLYGARVGDA